MLHDVDETLRRLLSAELANTPGCPVFDPEQISFDPPAVAEAVQDREAHVNLYLYDVRENVTQRDESFRTARKPEEGLAGRRRAAARLDLSYLVTVYAGDDPATEHRLLSDVLGVLMRCQAAPEAHLNGSLEGAGPNGVLLAVAQPDHVAFQDPAGLWQALGGRLRPALSLVANAPFNPFETKWVRVVREAVLGFTQGAGPGSPRLPVESAARVSVAGVVVDAQSEQPLPGVRVRADGFEDREAASGDGGFFYLLNLPPGGPHRIVFQKRGYRTQEIRVAAPPPGRLDQLEHSVVSLRRQTDAEWAAEESARAEAARNDAHRLVEMDRVCRVSLSGRLRFADGRPAAYVPVRAAALRGTTDAEGFYQFFDLPPGEHAVTADLPGRGEVEVARGDGTSALPV